MRASLRIETMIAAASVIEARVAVPNGLSSLGISLDDYKLLTQSTPWTGIDRQRVSRTIQSVCYALLDVLGIPRFDVPAEYLGAVLSIFVHKSNLMLACVYSDRLKTCNDMLCPDSEGEPVSPSTLFCLCLQFLEDPLRSNTALNAFNKRVGLRELTAEDSPPS